jgi:hypothetical protein
MTDATSFEEALAALVRVAVEAHENGNMLQGQLFADERGWLKEEELADMERRQARDTQLRGEVERGVARMVEEHAERWRAWLAEGIKVFDALRQGQVVPRPGQAVRDMDFDRMLARDLRQAWQELKEGKEGQSSFSWALAVGSQLRERYAVAPHPSPSGKGTG